MNTLYNKIKELCETAGIKPGKMCDDIGISRSMMSSLAAGRKKTLSAETLSKIAKYFGVSVDYFVDAPANSPENRTVEMLQSLRDADRALLEVARGMDESAVYAAAEFIRKLKGGSADAD